METSMAPRVTPLRAPELELTRTPPYNNEAEQGLLGALLITRISTIRRPSRSNVPNKGYSSSPPRGNKRAGFADLPPR